MAQKTDPVYIPIDTNPHLVELYRMSRCVADYYKWDNYKEVEEDKRLKREGSPGYRGIKRKIEGYYNGLHLHAHPDLIIETTDISLCVFRHTVVEEEPSYIGKNGVVTLPKQKKEYKSLVFKVYAFDRENTEVHYYEPPDGTPDWEQRIAALYKIALEDKERKVADSQAREARRVAELRATEQYAKNVSPYKTLDNVITETAASQQPTSRNFWGRALRFIVGG